MGGFVPAGFAVPPAGGVVGFVGVTGGVAGLAPPPMATCPPTCPPAGGVGGTSGFAGGVALATDEAAGGSVVGSFVGVGGGSAFFATAVDAAAVAATEALVVGSPDPVDVFDFAESASVMPMPPTTRKPAIAPIITPSGGFFAGMSIGWSLTIAAFVERFGFVMGVMPCGVMIGPCAPSSAVTT